RQDQVAALVVVDGALRDGRAVGQLVDRRAQRVGGLADDAVVQRVGRVDVGARGRPHAVVLLGQALERDALRDLLAVVLVERVDALLFQLRGGLGIAGRTRVRGQRRDGGLGALHVLGDGGMVHHWHAGLGVGRRVLALDLLLVGGLARVARGGR